MRIRGKKIESLSPDNACTEETYAMCVKGEGTIARHEIQKSITYEEEEFEALKDVGHITDDMFIKKHYYTIMIDDKYELTVGVIDEGTDNEFCYGEIEFESEEEANAFVPPAWFGKDVTSDKSYKMKNYWKRTRLNL